ncbi:MAG: hypothetical protein LBR10_08520 [Prevotellaceae bacterium]|jgi:hypothetical protein|nr:hypothetical protein [Prevotellaceae bacterium]
MIIWEWVYALLWCLLLIEATFPSIFLDYNFSFLLNGSEDKAVYGISKSYMFAIVMVVVLHLLDMAHIVMSVELNYAKMRRGFLCTLFSIILVAISLSVISSVENQYTKIMFFILFWAVLFVYKLISVNITAQSVRIKKVEVNEYNVGSK